MPNRPKINLPKLSSKGMQEVVAVDLGTSKIKIIVTGKAGEITKTVIADNPLGYSVPTKATQVEPLANLLRDIFGQNKLPRTNLALAMPERHVSTQVISIPTLTDSELATSISWQAQQYIPIPTEELVLNYQVLYRPEKKDAATTDMRVLLAGIKQDDLNNLTAAYKQASLEPTVLETESIATLRHLPADLSNNASSLIINFGAGGVDTIIVSGSELTMAMSHPTGSTMITKALMATFNLTYEKAEEYKLAYGVDTRYGEGKIAQAIVPILQNILGDIRNTITFYNNKNPVSAINKIFLSGGGALMPGFPELLAANLNIEIQPLDIFATLTGEIPENNQLIFGVAGGLTKRKG